MTIMYRGMYLVSHEFGLLAYYFFWVSSIPVPRPSTALLITLLF